MELWRESMELIIKIVKFTFKKNLKILKYENKILWSS